MPSFCFFASLLHIPTGGQSLDPSTFNISALFYCHWSIKPARSQRYNEKINFSYIFFTFCSGSLPHSFQCRLQQDAREAEKQSRRSFTFTSSLHVSLQAAGRAAVLWAAEASARTAGGAREFTDTILVVVTTASQHRAARHLLAGWFTAETRMIAWKKNERVW